MKKTLLFIFIVVVINLFAQGELGYWSNIRHSAVTESGDIYLRCETNPAEQTQFLYRNDEDIWHTEWMEVLQGTTHETNFPYSAENPSYCRFKTSTDDFVAMMPAFMPENTIPEMVHSLGFIAADPEGDTDSVPELDIINTFIGYSDEKIFAGLQNVSGSYPTDSGGVFPSEYYLYISGFINVETAVQDTVMYGMVYTDVPVFFSAGLYKFVGTEFSLDALEKIGDITHSVVDDVLIMTCDWNDLLEDEHFGDWPSLSNTLAFQFMTETVNFDMEMTSADESVPSMQTFLQYVIEPFENNLPEISNVDYSINTGSSTISFTYFDENSNFPLTADVLVNSILYDFIPNSLDFAEPITFSTTIPSTEWEEGLIRVSDNNIDYVEEEVIVTSNQTTILPIVNHAQAYPNPFNPETNIRFSLQENQFVSIAVFDCKGRKRETLFHKRADKGEHTVVWKAEHYPSGLYLIQIQAGNDTQILKSMLLK